MDCDLAGVDLLLDQAVFVMPGVSLTVESGVVKVSKTERSEELVSKISLVNHDLQATDGKMCWTI